MLTIGCPMAFANYPMDIQICRMELQSFGYSNEYNDYIWRKTPFLKKNILLEDQDVKLEDFRFIYKSDGRNLKPQKSAVNSNFLAFQDSITQELALRSISVDIWDIT